MAENGKMGAMAGRNHLILCTSELKVAVQEYLERRWPEGTPQVVDIVVEDRGLGQTFKVALEAQGSPA